MYIMVASTLVIIKLKVRSFFIVDTMVYKVGLYLDTLIIQMLIKFG